MTPEEFDAEFTQRKTWRSRFWNWYYNFCPTCRGQQYSTVTETLCPTCHGDAWPFDKTRSNKLWRDLIFTGLLRGWPGANCPDCDARPGKKHGNGCKTGAWDGGTWA